MADIATATKMNSASTDDAPLALYVHWPFCVVKCPYCDFNSHVREGIDHDAWSEALLADLRHEADLLEGRQLGSIFFGGGTPSLMKPDTVRAVIDAATGHWRCAEDLEITLEANPNSAEAAKFADLAAAGVNRLSLGLQSFDDEALRFLGRAHDAAEGLAALDAAQANVERVSFDIIYALPGDVPEIWARRLETALSLGTEHLSLYQLTIEPGTRFETMVRKGDFAPIDEEMGATLFELTQDVTAAAGMPAYEISNHARPGAKSRHNLTYWRYQDYAGIGPGAHGRRHGQRTTRHRKPENFINAVTRNGHGIVEEAALTREEAAHEALVMGLRLAEGIDPEALAARIGVDRLVDDAAVQRMARLGLLRHDERLKLTPAGRLLLDTILGEIAA